MPNPTPIYLVQFNGSGLNGYAVDEDIPLAMRLSTVAIIGADGGILTNRKADFRSFRIGMRILSRLSSGTSMQHLDDCKDQWRENLALLTRVEGAKALYVGETDRFIMCEFEGSSAPLTATSFRAISFGLNFKGNPPWFIGEEVSVTDAISGNDTISLVMGDTRRTYPTITIPSGITHINFADGTGKNLTFSGSGHDSVIVDCATLQATDNGVNALSYIVSPPDFGFFWDGGAGTFSLDVEQVTGSGNVTVAMTPRYER